MKYRVRGAFDLSTLAHLLSPCHETFFRLLGDADDVHDGVRGFSIFPTGGTCSV